jgi:hypothetical protein
MQFDGRAERSCSKPQPVALGSSPRAPFDDDRQTARQKLLPQIPLECLYLCSSRFIPHVDRELLHPIIWAKPNCVQGAF